MDIMMGLSAIKQTLDITKDLRDIDDKINVADIKLRLSDIVERLLEAREALYDAKERERELLEKIVQLEAALNKKPRLQDERGLLYEIDESNARKGEPYCNQCYVKEDKLFRMLSTERATGFGYVCSNCKTLIITQKKPPIQPRTPHGGSWMDR